MGDFTEMTSSFELDEDSFRGLKPEKLERSPKPPTNCVFCFFKKTSISQVFSLGLLMCLMSLDHRQIHKSSIGLAPRPFTAVRYIENSDAPSDFQPCRFTNNGETQPLFAGVRCKINKDTRLDQPHSGSSWAPQAEWRLSGQRNWSPVSP